MGSQRARTTAWRDTVGGAIAGVPGSGRRATRHGVRMVEPKTTMIWRRASAFDIHLVQLLDPAAEILVGGKFGREIG